jgi:hypothetical protein
MNKENLSKLKLAIYKQVRICSIMEMFYGEEDEKTILAFEILSDLYRILLIAEGRCRV